MKRVFLLICFALTCIGAIAQPKVTVMNNTGYTIRSLYISPGDSDKWEEDLLGRTTLSNGKSFQVTLPKNGVWDFKAVDSDNDNYFKWNVLVRGNMNVEFTIGDYKPSTASSASTSSSSNSGTSVTVVNNTGYTIYYLYISRDESDSWEEDVLDDDVLLNGSTVKVNLPGPGVWDFKAVDSDRDNYFRYGITISRGNNRVEFNNSHLSR